MSDIQILNNFEEDSSKRFSPELFLNNLYTAESGLQYPEKLPPQSIAHVGLDLSTTPLALYQRDVDSLSPEDFALIRRDGFGGSDSGTLLGVNPFTSITELIHQKATKELSQEEIETGEQVAVMKGNDLEPLIIDKFEQIMQLKTIKPTDMYTFKEHPYLKMNFDGVTGSAKQYIPVEIKVVTKKGERHYDPTKAIYIERQGFRTIPRNMAETNNAIATKASLIGIPPYYYTQLQQEQMALNAPFGFLCALFESTWTIHIFFAYRDVHVWNMLKIQGFKAWQRVEVLREKNGYEGYFDKVSQPGIDTGADNEEGKLD